MGLTYLLTHVHFLGEGKCSIIVIIIVHVTVRMHSIMLLLQMACVVLYQ